MNQVQETITLKKGEDIIQLGIRRSLKGLLMTVKVHPCIEEMFKEWASGEVMNANTHGRKWQAEPGKSLRNCYASVIPGGGVYPCNGGRYRLDQLGTDLYVPAEVDGRTPWVNMGFLRFCGASKEEVKFLVKGVYSLEAVDAMHRLMKDAAKQLYLDFIKPVDYVVTITAQEIPSE